MPRTDSVPELPIGANPSEELVTKEKTDACSAWRKRSTESTVTSEGREKGVFLASGRASPSTSVDMKWISWLVYVDLTDGSTSHSSAKLSCHAYQEP